MRKMSLGLVALTLLNVSSLVAAQAADPSYRPYAPNKANLDPGYSPGYHAPSYGKAQLDPGYGPNYRGQHDNRYSKFDKDDDKHYGKYEKGDDKRDWDHGYSYGGLNARR